MPYLTPESTLADVSARVLYIPGSVGWLSIVSGALLELCMAENWEQSIGGITVDEAVSIALDIFESWQVATGQAMEIGSIQVAVLDTAPDGWLPMDGGDYAMSEYPELMAVYPSSLKDVPTAGRFIVPDMSGRTPIGSSIEYPLLETGGSEELP